MDNRHDNEMEQIQRGLEDFLEKELGQMGKEAQAGRRRRPGAGQASAHRDAGGRNQGYLREDEYGPDGDGLEDAYEDGYPQGDAYGCGRMQPPEETESLERPRSREEAGDRDRRYSCGEAGSRERLRSVEGADGRERLRSVEEADGRGRTYSRREDEERERVYSGEERDDDQEYPREDEDGSIYDWDSKAPHRRNTAQRRPYAERDYEREDDYEYAGSRIDRDHDRLNTRQGAGYDRSNSERDGDYGRSKNRQKRSYATQDHAQRKTGSRTPASARYEEERPAGERSREQEPPRDRNVSRRSAYPQEEPMSRKASRAQQPQKKKRKKKHRLLKFLIAAALIFALLGVGLYQLVGVVYGKMTYHEITSLAEAPMKEDGVVNILLIGNDSRENGEDGRSDAMILLSVSNKTKKIYMTSLLRDMYVDIPGHDGNRLNAAYSFGGAELLMETIEKNLDISVNRYVLVNFQAFANLVDAVGGIELDLTKEEKEYVNGYLVEYNILTDRPQGTDNIDASQSGPVLLNGPQALAYSRNRYLGTDFGRTDRQRKVLTAVIGKLPSALISNPKGLMDGLLPNLTTNLTRGECFSLSLMAGKALTYDIESDSIPQPGTYRDVTIRKMQVLEVDFGTNIQYLKEKLYGE